MQPAVEPGQQTLVQNSDGTMGIAAKLAVVAQYIIPSESILRAHQVLQQHHQLEKANTTREGYRNKSATIMIAKQKDMGLKSKENPLRPIAQIALAQNPKEFCELYMEDSGITFDGWVEDEAKHGSSPKMKVLLLLILN
jgi:hypothetical protein